jgi:hypothetical protein
MTGDPPSAAPAYQVNRIFTSDVIVGSFSKEIGASGTSYITAPEPSGDYTDSPYRFTDETIALTWSSFTRLYGAA